MKLFEPKKLEGHPNDPLMINPLGAEIRVPQERVAELFEKGFKLVDPSWQPPAEEVIEKPRTIPRPLSQLKDEIGREIDPLEVTQIL